jgi:hypothetical protein
VTTREVPPGYERRDLSGVRLVSRQDAIVDLAAMLRASNGSRRTLHAAAASRPDARTMMGRGPAYAIRLPHTGLRVVVRHNRHGGLFAPLTGDRFLGTTSAPHELALAMRLAAADVPTPAVIAYAVYGTGIFRRADVVTEEVGSATDLGAVLVNGTADERARAWRVTHALLQSLARAGARHHDLNAKNVLIPAASDVALVLDVDRVVFGQPGDPAIARGNVDRLARSARKLRSQQGATVSDAELAALTATSGA